MMQKVTAVILNYNSSADCQKCIGFLRQQDYEALNIIVVDNASTKLGEAETLHKICEENKAKLLLHTKNGGFSAGNNVGFRQAIQDGADWMLVINPDVELRDSHYISFVMEQLPNWPKTAVIGTNVVLPSGEKQNPMREVRVWEEIFWPLENVKQRLGLWDGYRSKDETGYCEKVSGCCFFVSQKFLMENNFLDENVFMYCEEPILGKSVLAKGYKELYIKEVTANHEHYAHQKEGSGKTKMLLFLDSRLYYIKVYSGYPFILKSLAIFSRRIHKWICKIRCRGM